MTSDEIRLYFKNIQQLSSDELSTSHKYLKCVYTVPVYLRNAVKGGQNSETSKNFVFLTETITWIKQVGGEVPVGFCPDAGRSYIIVLEALWSVECIPEK